MFSGCWGLVLGIFYTPSKNTRTNADQGVFIHILISNTLNHSRFEFNNTSVRHIPDKSEGEGF